MEIKKITYILMTFYLNVLVEQDNMLWVKPLEKLTFKKIYKKLGLELNDDEIKKVTQRIIELGDKKEIVTTEDLPYIISDILNTNVEQKVAVKSYVLTHSKGLRPTTAVSLEIEGELIEENAPGDGQFDAFMNAIKKYI